MRLRLYRRIKPFALDWTVNLLQDGESVYARVRKELTMAKKGKKDKKKDKKSKKK